MATSYWLTFRLRDSDGWERTYQKRLADLHAEIETSSGGGSNWWFEPTSFYIFSSNESIDQIVTRVKRAIDERVDCVVIGMNEFKGGRVVGACQDQDVFALFPDAQKA